jgi:hypothetical protein
MYICISSLCGVSCQCYRHSGLKSGERNRPGYLHIYVYIYQQKHIYLHIHIKIYININLRINIHMYIYIYIYIYIISSLCGLSRRGHRYSGLKNGERNRPGYLDFMPGCRSSGIYLCILLFIYVRIYNFQCKCLHFCRYLRMHVHVRVHAVYMYVYIYMFLDLMGGQKNRPGYLDFMSWCRRTGMYFCILLFIYVRIYNFWM